MKRLGPRNGFSLVEVTIAIGIMAVALVPVVSLLPIGLDSYRKAVEISVGTQIVQRVVSDLQHADFDTITSTNGSGLKQFPIRYFDDQGSEKMEPTDEGAIYQVAYGTLTPAPLMGNDSAHLAQITIDIIYNPGRVPLTRDSNTGGVTAAKGIAVSRFSAFVARN